MAPLEERGAAICLVSCEGIGSLSARNATTCDEALSWCLETSYLEVYYSCRVDASHSSLLVHFAVPVRLPF